MKVAIMQPYFFPYYGYYQMIGNVDFFVILDDVSFIKKGFINRNYFPNQERFTVPLSKPSQNKLIKDTMISDTFPVWRQKFLANIENKYSKCFSFTKIYPLIENIMFRDYRTISQLSTSTLIEISSLLEFKTKIVLSSELQIEGRFDQKLINISKHLDAEVYINSVGGKTLYDKEKFRNNGIELKFIESKKAFNYVTIIDTLMNYDITMLKNSVNDVEFL